MFPGQKPMGAHLTMPPSLLPSNKEVPDFFIGTPDFFRSVDTVPLGTAQTSSPPPSLTTLPMGPIFNEMPITPRTAPASPSMSAPVPPGAVPMVVERRLGVLPHPDPGMIPHEANTNFAQEVAVKDVELHVLRLGVI